MAVTRAGSVVVVAADNDTVPGPITVCGIKYIAGTGSPSVAIKAGSTSGVVLWEEDGTVDLFQQVEFREQGTIHVDMAGTGTILYLYTKV
jgi:hypothetical protein